MRELALKVRLTLPKKSPVQLWIMKIPIGMAPREPPGRAGVVMPPGPRRVAAPVRTPDSPVRGRAGQRRTRGTFALVSTR
jgi:hypothetical protein